MTTHYYFPVRHCVAGTLLPLFLLACVPMAHPQNVPATASQPMSLTQVRLGGVVHVMGLDDKPGGVGDLSIDDQAITLQIHGKPCVIPLSSVMEFTTVHSDKPLLNGAKEKIAQAAPYGIGFAVTMSRPGAETLTLLYKDSSHAIHGAVLVLPKDSDKQLVPAMKILPAAYPKIGEAVRSAGEQTVSSTEMAGGAARPDIEVALPTVSLDGVPSAVPVAVYEEVIVKLAKSGRFAHVWRAGDVRRPAGTLALHLDVDGWKEGSARGRGFGPFSGATEIKAAIRLEDGAGQILLQGNAKGSKRLNGENLEAAIGLAKQVTKALEKNRSRSTKS